MQLKFIYISVLLTLLLPAGNMVSYHSPSWSILFHTFMYVNVIKNSNKYFILFYCTRVSVKAFRHSPPNSDRNLHRVMCDLLSLENFISKYYASYVR